MPHAGFQRAPCAHRARPGRRSRRAERGGQDVIRDGRGGVNSAKQHRERGDDHQRTRRTADKYHPRPDPASDEATEAKGKDRAGARNAVDGGEHLAAIGFRRPEDIERPDGRVRPAMENAQQDQTHREHGNSGSEAGDADAQRRSGQAGENTTDPAGIRGEAPGGPGPGNGTCPEERLEHPECRRARSEAA